MRNLIPSFIKRCLHLAPLLGSVAFSSTLGAHNLGIERTLMVGVGLGQVEILAIYAEPPGIRSERLLALYDLDRDGRLDGNELVLATPEVSKRAFLGLHILVDGQPANFKPSLRCKREKNRGQSCAVFGTFTTDTPASRVQVILDDHDGILTTPTRISASDDRIRTLLRWNQQPHRGEDVVTLIAGNTLEASFETPASTLANPEALK